MRYKQAPTARRGEQLLPRAGELLWAFDAASPPDPDREGVVRHVAYRLAAHHLRQWDAEDASRDPRAADRAMAATKRAIDAMNAARVEMVEQIDAPRKQTIPACAEPGKVKIVTVERPKRRRRDRPRPDHEIVPRGASETSDGSITDPQPPTHGVGAAGTVRVRWVNPWRSPPGARVADPRQEKTPPVSAGGLRRVWCTPKVSLAGNSGLAEARLGVPR